MGAWTEPGGSIDVCQALDLVAEAARDGADEDDNFLRKVFTRTGVVDDELAALQGARLIDLYVGQQLPITITLGAALVLDAAQRARAQGRGWSEAFAAGQSMVERILDLVPGRVLRSVALGSTS